MEIQTTITKEQGAALAQQHNVASYKDGNDLIAQVAAQADTEAKRRALIGAVAVQKDVAVLDAAIAAVNETADKPVSLPPIKLKPAP